MTTLVAFIGRILHFTIPYGTVSFQEHNFDRQEPNTSPLTTCYYKIVLVCNSHQSSHATSHRVKWCITVQIVIDIIHKLLNNVLYEQIRWLSAVWLGNVRLVLWCWWCLSFTMCVIPQYYILLFKLDSNLIYIFYIVY